MPLRETSKGDIEEVRESTPPSTATATASATAAEDPAPDQALVTCQLPSCVRCSRYARVHQQLEERYLRRGRRIDSSALRCSIETTLMVLDDAKEKTCHRPPLHSCSSSSSEKETSAAAQAPSGTPKPDVCEETTCTTSHQQRGGYTNIGHPEEYVLFWRGLDLHPWYEEGTGGTATQTFLSAIRSAGLASDHVLDRIRAEFSGAWEHEDAEWVFNRTSGATARGWKTLPLLNQGVENVANTRLCRETYAAVTALGDRLLTGCVFGNCCVSVLEAGAGIAEHRGPCNVRVRCHVPLHAPDGAWLEVDGERRGWSGVPCLLFNDAYAHRARHDGPAETAGSRVVLLFDLWHPDLSADEREEMCYFFPAG